MTPDRMIDRQTVMGALDIKSYSEFRKMLNDGLIPPAVGQHKKTHLWSNTIVQTFRKYAQELGVKGSRELVEKVYCDALIRLTSEGTMHLNSNLM
ncbi:MAG: hypothetical protein ACO3B3_09870 [Cyanobium sp.]|jgi:hypothetical protein